LARIPFLLEDPESSKSIKPSEEGKFLRGHQRRRNSLLQFQQPSIIHPPEEGKKITPEESLLLKSKTAIEINEERFPFFGDQDVPLMP
jgi:hypothetical protein